MSWTFKYLVKLQNQIESYRDKMLYIVKSEQSMDKTSNPKLLKISQELDQYIVSYQNFKKNLTEYQSLPYSVDFYMDTNKLKVMEIENINLKEKGINKKSVAVCDAGTSIWRAYRIFQERCCQYLIVTNQDGHACGILDREYVRKLCSQKTFTVNNNKKFYRLEEAFDKVPISVFVLDKDLYIEYINSEAIKNFNEVLPRNYLYKKADLVFSSYLGKTYHEFINGEFWQALQGVTDQSEIEVKILNYISLLANVKFIRRDNQLENVIISFINVDDLQYKVAELTLSTDELSQALSLFLPFEIEKILKKTPEYRDIYDYKKRDITIISKLKDGGYWHIINCLRILSQIERIVAVERFGVNKNIIVQTLMVHDIGKNQPELNVGDIVDPCKVFENSQIHAARSATLCKEMGYPRDIVALVQYHHHKQEELPTNFPQRLFPALQIIQTIDGLSAAITRRNAGIHFELLEAGLLIHEGNKDRHEYSTERYLPFRTITQTPRNKPGLEATQGRDLQFLGRLIQNMAIPAFILDIQQTVIAWNGALQDLTGVSSDEIIGTKEYWTVFYDHKRPCIADIVLGGCLEELPKYYEIYSKSGTVSEGLEGEGWFKNFGGKDRYILFNASPIRNTEGELIAVLETLQDITERKLAEMAVMEQNKIMQNELEVAARVQLEMLPQKITNFPGVNFAWEFKPSLYVAGDMLNIYQWDEQNVVFYVLDVSGHGVSAALKAINLNYFLKLRSPQSVNQPNYEMITPANILQEVAGRFADQSQESFFTIFIAVLNLKTKSLTYTRAGHYPPIVLAANGETIELAQGHPAVGLRKKAVFKDYTIQLNSGDKLILYTDGVIEAQNNRAVNFTKKGLVNILNNIRTKSIDGILNEIMLKVTEHVGESPQSDDITLLGIEIV